MKEKMEVVWPGGRSVERVQSLAPRLEALEGKTICGLFNGAFYFEKTWPLVKQVLSNEYPGLKFVGWEEFGLFHGPEEMELLGVLPGKLRQYGCDAVISGRGC